MKRSGLNFIHFVSIRKLRREQAIFSLRNRETFRQVMDIKLSHGIESLSGACHGRWLIIESACELPRRKQHGFLVQ